VQRRILLLAALLAAALAAWGLGLPEAIERERLREAVAAAGPLGPLVFVALFSALQALGVPGLLFIGVAIVAWPPWQAFLLVWSGSLGAGCVGFAFARTVGRRWVSAHLPERFRRFDARLATSGLRYVIAVRLLFYLAPPAHWLLGLSGVPFRTAVVGSAIGFAPGSARLQGLARPRPPGSCHSGPYRTSGTRLFALSALGLDLLLAPIGVQAA